MPHPPKPSEKPMSEGRKTAQQIMDSAFEAVDSVDFERLEGVVEQDLLKDAEKSFEHKQISPEAHLTALFALHKTSFGSVMKWYERLNANGGHPKNSNDYPNGTGRYLPVIAKKNYPLHARNPKMEAIRILFETVKHFVGYVGGKEALLKRWGKKDISWRHVMYHEVDKVRKGKKKTKKEK